jgi:ribose 5-phosphate isomerase B
VKQEGGVGCTRLIGWVQQTSSGSGDRGFVHQVCQGNGQNGNMKIAAGADHAGVHLKDSLVAHLRENGHEVTDLGTQGDGRVDYPDYGAAVARAVVDATHELGVAVCGSGIGIAMAANKVPGGRGATCHDVTSARLARLHNNANVICIGARLTGPEVAKDMVDVFLVTPFEGGRHADRVKKLAELDAKVG